MCALKRRHCAAMTTTDKPQALQLPTPDLPSIHRVASSAARGEALPAAVRERALEGIVGELARVSPQLPHHE